jgi:hypothetical protein
MSTKSVTPKNQTKTDETGMKKQQLKEETEEKEYQEPKGEIEDPKYKLKQYLQETFLKKNEVITNCVRILGKIENEMNYVVDYESIIELYKGVQLKLANYFPTTANAMNLFMIETQSTTQLINAWKEVFFRLDLKKLIQQSVTDQLEGEPIMLQNVSDIFHECCYYKFFKKYNLGKIILEIVKSKNVVKEFVDQYLGINVTVDEDNLVSQTTINKVIEPFTKLLKAGVVEFVTYALEKFPYIGYNTYILYECYKLNQEYQTENYQKILKIVLQYYEKFSFVQKSQKQLCSSEQSFDQNNIPNPIVSKNTIISLYTPVLIDWVDVDEYFSDSTPSNKVVLSSMCQINVVQDNYTNSITKQLDYSFDLDFDWYKKQIQYICNLTKEDKYIIRQYTGELFPVINKLLLECDKTQDERYQAAINSVFHYFSKTHEEDIPASSLKSQSNNKESKINLSNRINKIKNSVDEQINKVLEKHNKRIKQPNHIPFFVSFCKYFKLPSSTKSQTIHKKISSFLKDQKLFEDLFKKVVQIEIESISRIINDAPHVTKPFCVYRGTHENVLKSVETDTMIFKSFLSTSLSPNVSLGFTNEIGLDSKSLSFLNCCLNKITILPGTKCLFVSPLSISGGELEILLNRDQLITINKKNVPIHFQRSENEVYTLLQMNKKETFDTFQSKVCNLKQHTFLVDFLTVQAK